MYHRYKEKVLFLIIASTLSSCASGTKNPTETMAHGLLHIMTAASIPAVVLWKCLDEKGLTDSEIKKIEMDFSYSVSFDTEKKHLKISRLTWKNVQTKREALDSCKRSLNQSAEKELSKILVKKGEGEKSKLILDVNGTTFSKDFRFKGRDSSEIKGTFKIPGNAQSAK